MEKDNIKLLFDEYVSNYDMQDDDISYKYYHSYRVMELSLFLAKELNLSSEEINIAKIIGLYHDIGRFEQDKKYNSFEDKYTFDHGDYGAKIMVENDYLSKLNVNKKYHNCVIKAIKNHNKRCIENDLSEDELLFCKLIRDADKIDILCNVWKREKEFFTNNYDEVYEVVKKQFYENHTIDSKSFELSKYKNSNIVFYFAFVFDFNFKEAYQYLDNHHVLDTLYKKAENKRKIKEYYEYAKKYMKEMIIC